MNTKLSIGLTSQLTMCAAIFVAATLLSAFAASTPIPGPGGSASAKPIPWTEVGAAAGAQYSGDGLTVRATEHGARLHCVFQRLEGEVTGEGLWLTSTVTNLPNDRFRVVAAAVGREGKGGDWMRSLTSRRALKAEPPHVGSYKFKKI